MLVIYNREEIQQFILNETGSPEATDYILEVLEKQEYLSQIYDEYIDVSKDHPFFADRLLPSSIEVVEKFYTLGENLILGKDGKVHFSDKVVIVTYNLNPELVEQIADTITEGEFKLYQENYTNASKEEFKTKIKDLLTKAIKKIRIEKKVKKRHKNRNKK